MKKRVAPAAPLQTQNESGVAMIMGIIWSAVLLLLVLMVSQAVIAAIRPSDTNETSFRALAAAEAGVDDYRARLALVGSPASVTSAALTGWVLIPGGTDNAYFTYRLIDDQSLNTGEIKVRSTGWVAGVTRTVDAVLRKRTSYDYGYVSGNETVPGDFPDAYSGKGGELTPDQAEAFCSKQWFEPALKSTASTVSSSTTSLIPRARSAKQQTPWSKTVRFPYPPMPPTACCPVRLFRTSKPRPSAKWW